MNPPVDFKVLNSLYYYSFVHHFVIILNGCEWHIPASNVIPFEMSAYEEVMVNEFFGLLKGYLFETNKDNEFINKLEDLKFNDIEVFYPSNKSSNTSNGFTNVENIAKFNNPKLIIKDRKTIDKIDSIFERAIKE